MLSLAFIRQSFYTTSRAKVACIARRHLNRILFDLEEVEAVHLDLDDDAPMMVRLQAGDGRAMHIRNILKLQAGDAFRCGVLNVGMTNHAVTCDGGTGQEAMGELMINLGRRKDMFCNVKPAVDIILATPRPQKLERLIPIISCLGVGSIILIEAKKVVKEYFGKLALRTYASSLPIRITRHVLPLCLTGCHLLRHSQAMRQLLIEGLSQAEVDCMLPELHIKRNLKDLLENELDGLINGTAGEVLRLIAHPPLESSSDNLRMSSYIQDCIDRIHSSDDSRRTAARRIVIAVGPEGGWDREEVLLFQRKGFQLVNVGPRILRTDIAVPVLLGIAHEYTGSL